MVQSFDLPASHHEKHWVSDGNVVLSAVSNKKDSTILFRIHKSLLSDQSEVFAGMFELPQGGTDFQGDFYEGLPLVRLPDTAEEVCALLDALRDPIPLSVRTLNSDTPIRIRNALHMASKYLMTNLRANLVNIFESEWPLTVEALETKDQLFIDYLDHDEYGVRTETYILEGGWPLHFVPEPASALALAEDYDIMSLLPAAYYDLLRCDPRKDWELTEWDCNPILDTSDKPARWECLSRRSLRKIYRLQDMLFEETQDQFRILGMAKPKGYEDHDPKECRKVWVKLLQETREIPRRVQDRDILYQLRSLRIHLHKSTKICSRCRFTFSNEIMEARDDAWAHFKNACLEDVI